MKSIAAVLATAAALSGIAPTAAFASTSNDSTCQGLPKLVKHLPIPLC
jgi:hypothetical protein